MPFNVGFMSSELDTYRCNDNVGGKLAWHDASSDAKGPAPPSAKLAAVRRWRSAKSPT